MSKIPSLNYDKVIHALRRDGWIIVRQKGSHIRMQKATINGTLNHILKQSRLSPDEFLHLL